MSHSLPQALIDIGQDVRVIMPGYRDAISAAGQLQTLATFNLDNGVVNLLEGTLPDTSFRVWLVDIPAFFDRRGNPYMANSGETWGDNAERFYAFCRAIAAIAEKRAGLNWQPEIVHCNDWQTGLVPPLLSLKAEVSPACLFTIHNLAYQGLFPADTFSRLAIPDALRDHGRLKFHDQLSFIKGGLTFADRINTVSPKYSREIQTAEFGCGLEGLLYQRKDRLSGILNGIDTQKWNPNSDTLIAKTYSVETLENKLINKLALQKELKLPQGEAVPLIGLIGRLVQQKGIDLLLAALPGMLSMPIQFVVLGNGEPEFEQVLIYWARRFPDQIALKLGYDEQLAHCIEAGADFFLMPSRFEPCGLNQMYSQRYGTVPIVRKVGGLADTVCDASNKNLASGKATGVVFTETSAAALLTAIKKAILIYRDVENRVLMQRAGMAQDFSWTHSAKCYNQLYAAAIEDRAKSACLTTDFREGL